MFEHIYLKQPIITKFQTRLTYRWVTRIGTVTLIGIYYHTMYMEYFSNNSDEDYYCTITPTMTTLTS